MNISISIASLNGYTRERVTQAVISVLHGLPDFREPDWLSWLMLAGDSLTSCAVSQIRQQDIISSMQVSAIMGYIMKQVVAHNPHLIKSCVSKYRIDGFRVTSNMTRVCLTPGVLKVSSQSIQQELTAQHDYLVNGVIPNFKLHPKQKFISDGYMHVEEYDGESAVVSFYRVGLPGRTVRATKTSAHRMRAEIPEENETVEIIINDHVYRQTRRRLMQEYKAIRCLIDAN